jgi:hypothetical protein
MWIMYLVRANAGSLRLRTVCGTRARGSVKNRDSVPAKIGQNRQNIAIPLR